LSGWSGVLCRESCGVARETAVLGYEQRSTLAISVVVWTIDPLGRRSACEHRSTEASSAVDAGVGVAEAYSSDFISRGETSSFRESGSSRRKK
jgi:hypothetical protein